jgi:hypothetical protein
MSNSYLALSDVKIISFGHYLERLCIANGWSLVFERNFTREQGAMVNLFNRHIGFHPGFQGSIEWSEQF